jgi:hypothetical protein
MRKYLIALLFLVGGFAFVQPSFAQEEPAAPAAAEQPKDIPTSDLDTNGDGKISAEEAKALLDADAGVGDVVSGVSDTIEAAKDLKGKTGTDLALGISALLAVIFKMLLSLMKIVSKNTGWFEGARGKAALKYSTLALGGLAAIGAGIAMALGAGLAWWDVVIIALSGPGAMIVHEVSSLLPGVGKHASVPEPGGGGTGSA